MVSLLFVLCFVFQLYSPSFPIAFHNRYMPRGTLKCYKKSVLIAFMQFRDAPMQYVGDIVFPDNVLASITPTKITRWFKLKAYRDPDLDKDYADTKPTEGSSFFLEFYKKALSLFMPNKHLGYDVITE